LRALKSLAGESGSIRSKSELFEKYERCFQAVTKSYTHIKSLAPIVACQISNDDPTSRSEKLTIDGIHFTVDVERSTERALSDRPELQAVWFRLVAGEIVAPKLAKEVITLCGRVYAANKLEPWRYFRRNKYPERRAT